MKILGVPNMEGLLLIFVRFSSRWDKTPYWLAHSTTETKREHTREKERERDSQRENSLYIVKEKNERNSKDKIFIASFIEKEQFAVYSQTCDSQSVNPLA